MANPDHVEVVRQGRRAIEAWRRTNRGVTLDLFEADLSGVYLSKADFVEANLSGANLSRANLSEANLDAANLTGADLSKANLSKANLSTDLEGVNLSEANLTGADLSDANLNMANLSNVMLSEANLINADFHGANLRGANLSEADLSGAHLMFTDLTGANLTGANLVGAYLIDSELYSTRFESSNLTRAKIWQVDFRGAAVNDKTVLSEADVEGVTISRFTLNSLSDDFGGLSRSRRMQLNVVDGLAKLKMSYSGIWALANLISVTAFLLPYALFSFEWIALAQQAPSTANTATLMSALWDYARTGQRGAWTEPAIDSNCWHVLAFAFLIACYTLRTVISLRTKKAELQEDASGLPAPDPLMNPLWRRLYGTAIRAQVVALIVSLWSAYTKLSFPREIPMP